MRVVENRFNWYKGNMHMHTTVSDGVLTPKEITKIKDHSERQKAWQNYLSNKGE